MEFDTIAAISTALGEGAIAIVRVSGDDAVEKVDRIFKGKDLTEVPSHTIHYGHIVDLDTNQVIEEVMVSIMRAPRTFTRENIVEINCHGGLVSVNKVLQLILAQGYDWQNRANLQNVLLNGRIDLSQAEAVMDLIRAKQIVR